MHPQQSLRIFADIRRYGDLSVAPVKSRTIAAVVSPCQGKGPRKSAVQARKPIIAITPLFDEGRNSLWMLPGYHDMLIAAGALPIDVPLRLTRTDAKELMAQCDGLLLTGGQDIDPALYHQPRLAECGKALAARDNLDRMLLAIALASDMPVLGICRGLQVLNVHLGGTLFQDLHTQHPTTVEHCMTAPYNRVQHTIEVIPDSPLAKVVGKGEWGVNSYHHQSIKKLARCLQPMALSEDGLIEAAYHPDRTFAWAVQWHPELRWEEDDRQRSLCKAFSMHAREYRKLRIGSEHDP